MPGAGSGRPPALDKAQEAEVKAWLASGTTVDDAHARAEGKGWRVSRSTIGALAKVARAERAAGLHQGAAPAGEPGAEPTVAELAAQLRVLEERLQHLAAPAPAAALGEIAKQAVATAERLSRDPQVDPKVQVMALDKLPELIRLAQEIADAEAEAQDDGLFTAGA